MAANKIPSPIFNEFTQESVGVMLASKSITPGLVDKINELASSDELSQTFKENLTSYTTVLTKGLFTPAQYVSAVQYVSYRLMGHDVGPAWQKTFPDRYKALLDKGTTSKVIGSHASAYNKTKLVNLITEQSLIPSYIINNSYFQRALNIQVEIMDDHDVSPKVRSDAAHRVMEYTAMPDSLVTNKEDISDKGMDVIANLAASVKALAAGKRNAIIEGTLTTKEVAQMPIYEEGDYEDV
jgi:hypothetical protein